MILVESLPPNSGKKPVVGLAGFFGYGNYGDELFVSVFKEYLSDKFDLRFLSDRLEKPYYSKPVAEIVSEVDAIVIGGGDIVQPWGMDPRYFSKYFLEKPVFVAGVGVPLRSGNNSNHNEKDWIIEKYRSFFQSPAVKMVHARDEQSQNWIQKKLNPEVEVIEAPDIVCALTLPEAKKHLDAPILGIVTRQRPNQIDDYGEINRLAEQQRRKGWLVRHIILGSSTVGERDVLDAVDVTGQKELIYTPSLQVMSRAIGECTALISMKFHGSVVATMYGVPSTVLIPTNKNRNFMKRIGRDDLISKFNDPSLAERFSDGPPAPIDSASVSMLRSSAIKTILELKRRIEAEVHP